MLSPTVVRGPPPVPRDRNRTASGTDREIPSARPARLVEGCLIILAVQRRGVDRHDVELELLAALGFGRIEPLAKQLVPAAGPLEDQDERLSVVLRGLV